MVFDKKKEKPKPEEKKPEEKKKQCDCLHLKARSLTFNLPLFLPHSHVQNVTYFIKAKIMNGKVVVEPLI